MTSNERRDSAVAVGTFDGVHLGHAAVLDRLRMEAEICGCASVAMTFDRHPLESVNPGAAPAMLTDVGQRVALLEASGVDEVVVLPFDVEMAEMEPEDFLTLLVDRWRCRCLVMGHDNALGKGRKGTAAFLAPVTERMGIKLVVVGPVRVRGAVVSSSEIRRRLTAGDIIGATAMLGRRHSVSSTVTQGDGRGGRLGFATANLALPVRGFLPADGVYAAWARFDGRLHPAVVNLGNRPTHYPGEKPGGRSLEAHVMDFEGDLYGKELELEFAAYIRPERKFESEECLVRQVASDVERARFALGLAVAAE